MKTGIELIADERREQIEKHGWDLSRDADYKNGELVRAAKFCLNPNNISLWPWHDNGIGTHFYKKILGKDEYQRIAIAGSFCAAELDRINNITIPIWELLFKTVDISILPENMISKHAYNNLLSGEKTMWEPVYSYLCVKNYDFEKFELLGYKPYIIIPRREAE